MSDYRYEISNERLDIKPSVDERNVFIWVHEGRKEAAIIFPKTDAPTVALELLRAAGRTDLVGYIEAVIEEEAEAARIAEAVSPQGLTRCRLCNEGIAESAAREAAEKAEAEAAETKLQERRDAASKEFCLIPYAQLAGGTQKVVDAYLDLQDKLDGASRD